MPELVKAYLEWKHPTRERVPSAPFGGAASRAAGVDGNTFTVYAVYTHGEYTESHYLATSADRKGTDIEPSLVVHQQHDELANVALLRQGLLGCTPVSPEYAIDLRTLELYHRLRRHHAQLGFQAMTRALCDLHDVSAHDYRPRIFD